MCFVQVKSVRIGAMISIVPPSPSVPLRAAAIEAVIVVIIRRKLHTTGKKLQIDDLRSVIHQQTYLSEIESNRGKNN